MFHFDYKSNNYLVGMAVFRSKFWKFACISLMDCIFLLIQVLMGVCA